MGPTKAIRHEKEIGIEIEIVHDGSEQRRHTYDLRSRDVKGITRKNLLNEEWDDVSNIDEMIERQTFSQLICPDDGTLSEQNEDNNPLKKIGTSHIFTFPSDTGHPPSFISPDTSALNW